MSIALVCSIAAGLLIVKTAMELLLNRIDRQYIRAVSNDIPDALKDFFDSEKYEKARQYALEKLRFGSKQEYYDVLLIALVLFSPWLPGYIGVLPWFFGQGASLLGQGVWAQSLTMVAVGMVLSIPSMPWEWWSQFKLEEKYGFNRSTQKLWVVDRIKGLVLSVLIGCPVLAGVLWFVDLFPDYWWLFSAGFLMVVQLIMMVLYPMLILPLFNKLSPLEDGALKERLMSLSDRAGFQARTIQVIDGSKRSGHSNAFFTGFGKFRRIVLYDTLIEQMSPEEVEAVLAHEIGHYRKGHIPKMLLISTLSLFGGFAVLGWLSSQAWFFQAFGFHSLEEDGMAPALLLFSMLSGMVTFWLSPIMNSLSRKHEYEADHFASEVTGGPSALKSSLRRLHVENLSFPHAHKLYRLFYYSHPTLLEREAAMDASHGG